MKFKIYKDKAKEWRWRLVARNGRIMADSGEGYSSKRKARLAIGSIIYRISNLQLEIV